MQLKQRFQSQLVLRKEPLCCIWNHCLWIPFCFVRSSCMCCCKTGICSAADRASATGSRTNSVKRFGLCFSSFASQQELLKRYRSFLYFVLRECIVFSLRFCIAHTIELSLKHWQPQKWNVLCAKMSFHFKSHFQIVNQLANPTPDLHSISLCPLPLFINEFESLVFFVATAPGCVCFCAWADNPGVICNHFQSSQFQWR